MQRSFPSPYHEDLPGPGARCTEGQVEPGGNGLLDFQSSISSIRSKADAPLILSYPRSGETPCELVMGHRAPTFGPFDFRFTVTVTAPSAKSRT